MRAIPKVVCAGFAFVLAAWGGVAGAQEKKPPIDPIAQAHALRLVDAWLDAQRELDQIPALSAGVVRGGELAWSKGYGFIDANRRIAATPKTMYSVCSITKLFTSIAVMQLYEARKVRLDDDIAALVPAFRIVQKDADSAPITVRNALTHSGGIPREADFPYWSGDFVFPTTPQINERLVRQETLYRAGDRYQYSNLGMTFLGHVVSQASGQRYEDYVKARILDPLGMTDTQFGLPMGAYGTRLAVGHSARKRDGTRTTVKPFQVEGLAPAAGLVSTVDDLSRFVAWQFRLLKNGGSEILRSSTLREMQRIHWTDLDGKATWGLGFAVRYEGGKAVVGHGGWCPGYRTSIRTELADELGIIVLTNANDSVGKYTTGISKILAKAKKIQKPKDDEPALNLEEYAGRYDTQPWGTELVVVPWGANLAALSIPADDLDNDLGILKPSGKDTFRRIRDDDTLGTEVRFERDAGGRVTRIVSNSQFSPRSD